MFAVEPIGLGGRGDEELAGVGIFAGIGHADHAGLVVPVQKVFVGKGCSVNATLTRPVPFHKVTTLNHKVLNDPMEDTALVPRGLFIDKKLTSTQLTKVFTSPWTLREGYR